MNKTFLFSCALSMGLFSCTEQASNFDATALDSTALEAITEKSYKAHVAKLASDDFLGRKPFTKGDTLTVNYIEDQFKTIGLEPGNGDSYFQEVPMVEITSKPVNPILSFSGTRGLLNINYLDDYVIGTRKLKDNISINLTGLVFAGFGIVAPEYNWNDYEGLDVRGKTVVVMVSDPGRYDKNLFKADTMTYYGRWRYKFEEAGRQGATGILLIHETGAASYGWDVVRSGWSGPQLELTTNNQDELPDYEGWISL